MIFGITGLIGSGKSLAAETLKSWGAIVIDADKIGRDVVESSLPLRKSMARVFGADVLTPGGNLRRKLVAERAFADSKSQARLNNLVHPYLLRELRRQIKAAKKRDQLIAVEAALLLDWNLDREIDCVLLVHASLERRIKRLVKRGLSEADAVSRTRAQLPYREYRRRANIVIFNNSTKSDFIRKLRSKLTSLLP